MAKFNDYNESKLGTSNGTRFFPAPNLLEDKIPDSFPSNPNEAAIADLSSLEMTNANLSDYFSYHHQHIGQSGLIRYTPGQGVAFTYGSGKFYNSPLKDSLGALEVFEPGFPVVPARAYNKLQSVASQGKIYSQVVPPVPLPNNYSSEGLTHIQFTDALGSNNPIAIEPADEILDKKTMRQYVLLYGNSNPLNVLGLYVPTMVPGIEKHAFEKYRLGLLSLFFNVSQKREAWNYFYPTVNAEGGAGLFLPKFTNVKSLQFAGSGDAGVLAYDKTIDNSNSSFLSDLIVSDPDEYSKHISAIAYQTLIGGGGPNEAGVLSFDTLPQGIEKKMYSDFNYDLNIPISEEVVSYLDETGNSQEISQNTLVADAKPVYNFTITNYHQAMPLIPEIRIPNIYQVAQQGPENFLQGFYSALAADDPLEFWSGAILNFKEIPFFEKLADQFINCDEDEQSVYANAEYTKTMNIVWDKNSFTEQVEDLKEVFPMYVEVEFDPITPGLQTSELLANLYGNGIIQEYIRTMLTYFHGPMAKVYATVVAEEYEQEIADDFYKNLAYLADLGIIPEETSQSSVVTLNKKNSLTGKTDLNSIDQKTFNFNKWLSVYGEQAAAPSDPMDLIDPSLYNNYTRFIGLEEGDVSSTAQFVKLIKFNQTKDVYKKQVIGLQRTIDQILNGQKSASIPLYYVIEKREQETGTLIQNIIIPATPSNQGLKKDKIKYIDTQVKYNKAYSYSIKAQTIVIGSDYRFFFRNSSEEGVVASQAGYGMIKKEDLIFAELFAYTPNEIVLGDAFNYSGVFSTTAGILAPVVAPTLTLQQIQSLALEGQTSILGLTYTQEGEGGQAIEDSITSVVPQGAASTQAYIRPFYAFSEASTLKSPPTLGPKFVDITGNEKYTISPYGAMGGDVVWVDAATGQPSTQGTMGSAAYVLNTNEDGQTYFMYEGQTIFINEEGTVITQAEAESELYAIKNSHKKLVVFGTYLYPRAHMYETPYFEEEYVTILDKPPITPIVNFYPYKDVKNSLLITFENQTGDYEDIPISMLPQDGQIFLNVRKAQKRQWKDEQGNYVIPTLRFKSDDFASEYQVFRIKETKPSSYDDFSDSLYEVIDVRERTAFVDNLESNVKYYYVFRTIDLHQNLSNPSYLYEIEMVENSGVSFPLINVVDFATPPKDLGSRFFNRFLKIEPSLTQKIVNEEKTGIAPDGDGIGDHTPILGVREESIWNEKKFKFRIKSINTGKAIDLNVKFKTNHKQPDAINSCD